MKTGQAEVATGLSRVRPADTGAGIGAWGPVVVMGLLQSTLTACLPWLIERTGLSAGLWATLMSVGMLPVLVGAPGWGRAVDRYGANRVLAATCALILLAHAVLTTVVVLDVQGTLALTVLVLARLLHGVGAGGLFPAAQRLAVAGAAPMAWAYRLARLQIAVHAGRLAGPVVVMAAVVTGGPWVLVISGTLGLGLVLAGAKARPQGRNRTGGGCSTVRPSWRPGWPLYLLAITLTFAVGVLQFVLGPVTVRVAAVPADVAASLTALALVVASVTGLLAGPLIHGRVRSMVWQRRLWNVGFVLAAGVLVFADSVLDLVVGMAVLAFAAAILTPWYGSQLRQQCPDAQGAIAGRLTSLHTLGYILGTLTGGWLLEHRPEQVLSVFVLLPVAVWGLSGPALRRVGRSRRTAD